MKLLIFFKVAALTLTASAALKAGDLFKICHKNDAKINDCIKETLIDMKPLLKKGIPELKILSVDPMKIPKVNIMQGSGPVAIDSTFNNLTIIGITNYEITDIKSNMQDHKIEFAAKIPHLRTEGDYTISGRILLLPISGAGFSWSNYTGVTIKGVLQAAPMKKDQKNYLSLKNLAIDMNVDNALIHMENLFNGNKELGDAMNAFMATNWREMYQELKPVVENTVQVIFSDVINKVFSKFTFEELFPE